MHSRLEPHKPPLRYVVDLLEVLKAPLFCFLDKKVDQHKGHNVEAREKAEGTAAAGGIILGLLYTV